MSLSRRHFLRSSSQLSLLPISLTTSEIATALISSSHGSSEPSFGERYWSSLYLESTPANRAAAKHLTPEERVPAIYQFSDKTALRRSDQLRPDELPDFEDEAVVTIELTAFRPGSTDREALAQVNFANMHLSCQRVSGSAFIGPLAWATLATVFSSKAKSLPAVSSLDWSALSGQQLNNQTTTANSNPKIQHLLLSHGSGRLSVNITTTPKQSTLDTVLKVGVSTSKILTPLLGFPAISTVALAAFYEFYGKLEASKNANFLISTSQKDVVVAKPGLRVADLDIHPLYLLSGDYIFVPLIHQAAFEKKMGDLTLINGLAVEKSSTGILADRVRNAVPDVSYLSLSVRVQSASEVPNLVSITDPVLGDHPDTTSGKGAPKKHEGRNPQ